MAATDLRAEVASPTSDHRPPDDVPPEESDVGEQDAPLIFRKPRTLEDAEMDITPMIDIVFLLLIFFLVASNMQTAGDVTLPKASHAEAVSLDNAVILTIAKGPSGTAIVYKGDNEDSANRIASSDPEAQEAEILAYVDQVLVGEAKQYVLIKAAADIKHREVSRVAEAVGKSDAAETLHVAVLEGS